MFSFEFTLDEDTGYVTDIQLVEDVRPINVYSKFNCATIDIYDAPNIVPNFLSSLSQLAHDIQANPVPLPTNIYEYATSVLVTWSEICNTPTIAFANVANFMAHKGTFKQIDTIESAVTTAYGKDMYINSDGAAIDPETMVAPYLYNAIRKKLRNDNIIGYRDTTLLDNFSDKDVASTMLLALVAEHFADFSDQTKVLADEVVRRQELLRENEEDF